MRKLLVSCCLLFLGIGTVAAQSETEYGIANHLGVGVGVGTEGIGIDVATCFTPYLAVRLGVNFMPDFSVKADADVSDIDGGEYSGYVDNVSVKAGLKRTTIDLRADFYPFPNSSPFFISGGLSFGGSDILSVTGHSDEFAALAGAAKNYGINIGDYVIPFDDKGNIDGGVKVNSVRPYLGLGFGRLIPKGRIGARFEIGIQFQGKPKIYYNENGSEVDLVSVLDEESSDNISKVLDYLKMYPCLKFSLRGRIF